MASFRDISIMPKCSAMLSSVTSIDGLIAPDFRSTPGNGKCFRNCPNGADDGFSSEAPSAKGLASSECYSGCDSHRHKRRGYWFGTIESCFGAIQSWLG